jgi:hypothetical protein
MASSQCLSESSGSGIGIVVEVELLQPELESGLGEESFLYHHEGTKDTKGNCAKPG